MDKATKQKQSVTINLSGGLSEADIERMKAEAESNASADAAFKERLVYVFRVSLFCLKSPLTFLENPMK